ncbi:aldehyde dehydrogenase family 3 member H1 [Selaginella moellendorffii]|nr:aldehyde dehydrogenase family 3 member H1 [Selaginella moellendorffii]|eukprot:XP_002966702.2 aldehyde dehydrogenase family 3 member H1 [Selaginella moellendorffii]
MAAVPGKIPASQRAVAFGKLGLLSRASCCRSRAARFRPGYLSLSPRRGLAAATCTASVAMDPLQTDRLVAELRDEFRSGRTRPMDWRAAQLRAMLRMIDEREGEIIEALDRDIGKPAYETYVAELSTIANSCTNALKHLRSWMAPEKVSTSMISFPSSGEIVPEPLGVALVISAWNFPFLLSLDPVIGAICAGNAVVLKPSELAPATAALLAKLVPLYLDKKAIRVVEGGVPETTALLDQQWDKIFYTGSTRVGKIVMAAAAKNLTPVVLELGGKSPVLVDSNVDVKVTARRIALGKWGNNNAQACISPDYILADESVVPKLITAIKECLLEFYGDDPSRSKDIARVVNGSHFERLTGLLDEDGVKDKIVFGGARDSNKLFIAPTVILDPPADSAVMTEEIFGPLLPVIPVDSMESAMSFVNTRPKPLALYLFTRDKALEKKVVSETSAGGMVVNDTVLHFVTETMPFGGVGHSGMGAYHGKFSFDAFSHRKAVLYRGFWADMASRYPPYTIAKQNFVRNFLQGNYLEAIKALLQNLRS